MSRRNVSQYEPTVAYAGRMRRPYGMRQVLLVSGDKITTIPVPPWVAITLGFITAAMAVTLTVATVYLALRDDLIQTAFHSSSALVQAYERQIAGLRSEIDRISSHQILDQMAFDEKIDRLLAAQEMLDGRQKLVGALMEKARASGLIERAIAPTPSRMLAPGALPSGVQPNLIPPNGKAPLSPEADPSKNAYAPEVKGGERSRMASAATALGMASLPSPPLKPLLVMRDPETGRRVVDVDQFAGELKRMNDEQTASVSQIALEANRRAERIEAVLTHLGLPPLAMSTHPIQPDPSAQGGPYLPANSSPLRDAFLQAEGAMTKLFELSSYSRNLPLTEPVEGAAITSGFGNRPDPFLGSLAFHPGIDFKVQYGSPVPVTAAGVVVSAGWSGGYGNMVEVDHGNSLSTRYGHLSEIKVRIGDRIARGSIVGLVGSTGRSTGPHLHYETRVDGEALNPITYLDSGDEIRALLPSIN